MRAAQDYLKSGFLLAREGRDAEAARAFRQAVGIRPDWAEAHSLLGSTLARAGKYAEAEAELRKAVALKPDYAEGWNFLGEFLKDRGKIKKPRRLSQGPAIRPLTGSAGPVRLRWGENRRTTAVPPSWAPPLVDYLISPFPRMGLGGLRKRSRSLKIQPQYCCL